ncbi:hypothetical protein DPEC_G00005660 [Dallia pectoralis]|uniref:Uncharacterized protein n=1 Tax=Dallia pectoralis TaxID=75939 RepID=A0ACC2HKL3_DALPE|nr:hypothetical protein DPEC_G00005660 [Dallia pectoralis]
MMLNKGIGEIGVALGKGEANRIMRGIVVDVWQRRQSVEPNGAPFIFPAEDGRWAEFRGQEVAGTPQKKTKKSAVLFRVKMAMSHGVGRYCRLAGLAMSALSCRTTCMKQLSATRRYITQTAGNSLQFKLDDRTAHSSLDLFKKDTGVIYRILGLDPSHVQQNPERFRDWAVVFGDGRITGGRHYWEVTVKKSTEFRLGVAEASMSREDCVGTNSSSWVFGYVQGKWFAMTTNQRVPVPLVGKPDRVGILLDFEDGLLGLVDISKAKMIHSMKAKFRVPLCPAFGLWDGELLTHSGLEEPDNLK